MSTKDNVNKTFAAERKGSSVTGLQGLSSSIQAFFESLPFFVAVVAVHMAVMSVTQADVLMAMLAWPIFEFIVHKAGHDYENSRHMSHHTDLPFDAIDTEYGALGGWILVSLGGLRWMQIGIAWYALVHQSFHSGLLGGTQLLKNHRIHHACGASRFGVTQVWPDFVWDSLTR